MNKKEPKVEVLNNENLKEKDGIFTSFISQYLQIQNKSKSKTILEIPLWLLTILAILFPFVVLVLFLTNMYKNIFHMSIKKKV